MTDINARLITFPSEDKTLIFGKIFSE